MITRRPIDSENYVTAKTILVQLKRDLQIQKNTHNKKTRPDALGSVVFSLGQDREVGYRVNESGVR